MGNFLEKIFNRCKINADYVSIDIMSLWGSAHETDYKVR